jgi:hypothetical protein
VISVSAASGSVLHPIDRRGGLRENSTIYTGPAHPSHLLLPIVPG